MKKVGFFSIFFIVLNVYTIYHITGKYQFNIPEEVSLATISESNQLFLPIIVKGLPGYFVSPDGSDTNSGTFSQPWKTLGKAADMVRPGATVFLREGIYNESVQFSTSGTASSPITILAYPGENPVLDGGNTIPGLGRGLLQISGDYIYVSGIEIRNSAYDGIQVLGSYDTVDNMYTHHCQKHGIYVGFGHNSTVENNRVWRNALSNEYGKADNWSTGLTAARYGVSYATIRYNTVWENWGQGISTYEADHTVIEDNIVHDNFTANIYISDSTNILCQRNLVFTDPTSYMFPYSVHVGIMMGDEKNNPISANITVINNISFGNNWNYGLYKGTSIMNNILIANNTFINGITSGGVLLRGYHQNVRFENNIIQQDGPLPEIVITLDPDVRFTYNLWSKLPVEAASGPGDIIADPKLSQTGDPFSPEWFRPTVLSPAIDHALSISEVFDDFFRVTRDSLPDMGAIEYLPE